ncbi:TetR/AcrR family transcriptional regulator [Microbacterium elymi]|uniref:TetR family transcriptional regulator C-terminal domain-containing protein n=1 Tax=Microbacterium elymi TaxID=2909587 RepID=A0ABY5NMM6_9MICO|nr:TetR family transcriptional regulator C-terminal domain-containing protein [Microbacterium elymi]UUT36433.1 TetR family transcriptional regulator C-terminal domain-containing protein [Microbacterium elymi]
MADEAVTRARRQQLLEAGARVIAERGFANTRLADVAQEAGVSAPLIVHYFGTREQLLTDALQYTEDRFYELVAERLAPIARAADRLTELIVIDCSPEPDVNLPQGWALWFEIWNRAAHDRDAATQRAALDARWVAAVAEIIRQGQVDGDFRPEIDSDRAARMLTALLDGLSIPLELGDPAVTPDEALSLAFELRDRLLLPPDHVRAPAHS